MTETLKKYLFDNKTVGHDANDAVKLQCRHKIDFSIIWRMFAILKNQKLQLSLA